MSSHFEQRPAHFSKPYKPLQSADLKPGTLTPADRAILDSLRASGYRVAAITLKRGHGWVLRGITKASAA